jgi:hypothetical protein
MLAHQGSLDRSLTGQDVSTALPMPGKQTRVDASPALAGPSSPGVAKEPEYAEDAAGNAAPGAELFEDDGLTWIQRNDGAFECVKASFRKQGKRHTVVDRASQYEEWQRLDALQPARVRPPVQRKAAGTQGPANVHAAAAAGVRDASGALPYASAIQQSFGRHDIGGVKAAVGGAASKATAAIGATAYATGDRVAFGDAPDLHTAAHEAAHVVQQRSGVQLAGGVGSSGDRYEQHADRVADRVVAGGSAEGLLDEMVGGGGASNAVQRHDSPGHVGIGDSVPGEGVRIHDILFTPGQLSALADYVKTLDGLEIRFTKNEVQQMHDLLVAGDEDTMKWSILTNGEYAKEALSNEKHFAPSAGDGGLNFRSQFINGFKTALEATASGDADRGLRLGYGAEHYLQDAFSAGHQVAARDIEQEVDATVRYLGEATALSIPIATKVYLAKGDAIRCYWVRFPGSIPHPILPLDFIDLAMIGAILKGNGGISDGVRRFVHEQLEPGVEVRSDAHPQPFTLLGDHDIGEDAAEEGVVALQIALHEGRELLGKGADPKSSESVATKHFDRHCPTPTATGQATIRAALESGTNSASAIIDAVAETMIETIEDVMDTLVLTTKGLPGLVLQVFKMQNPGDPELHPFPEIDPYDPEAPVCGQPVESPQSYIPEAPQSYIPEAPVQRSEGTATATSEPATATEPTGSRVALGEAATTFPLLQEIAIPSPYGTMKVSAALNGSLDLAPDAETGAPPAVEVGVGTGPEGASIDAKNLLAGALGTELGNLADTMSLKSTGELEYALGFEEIDLPGFGPITQKFQFQLVEVTASLTKLPEVKFGTFTVTGTLAVPPQFDVSGSIAITIKLEPNWWAIGRTLVTQTAARAVAGEVAAGEAAAGGGAGLGVGPLAAGAVGALIITKLVAEAYVRADGHEAALEYAYVDGYSTALAIEIFHANAGLPPIPQCEITEQLTIRQYEGVVDAEKALAGMTDQDKESLRLQYTYDNFRGTVAAELRAKIRE